MPQSLRFFWQKGSEYNVPKASTAVNLDLSLDVRDNRSAVSGRRTKCTGTARFTRIPGIVCTAWVLVPSARVLLAQWVFSFCLVAEWYFDVLSSHERHESLLRFFFLLPKRVPGQIDLS